MARESDFGTDVMRTTRLGDQGEGMKFILDCLLNMFHDVDDTMFEVSYWRADKNSISRAWGRANPEKGKGMK